MSEEKETASSATEVLSVDLPTKEQFSELIPGKWSSHPKALKRQRIWLFAIGLIPLVALVVIGIVAFSDFRSWIDLIVHPGRTVAVIAFAVSFGVGVIGTVALVNLMGRSGVGNKDIGQDSLEISKTIMVVGSLLWLLPLAATFLPSIRGRGSLIFLLNLLCFVPLGIILLLVLFGGKTAPRPNMVLKRRKFWFGLGTFLAALGVLSLLTDVHALIRRVDWLKSVPLVQAGTLRLILLATLFPLSTICFSIWEIFKKSVPSEEVKTGDEPETPVEKKPWYRRLWDFFFGKKEEEEEDSEGYPRWVDTLRKHIKEAVVGIQVGEVEPLVGHDVASIDENNTELALLMGDINPTTDQSLFYRRLKDAYCDRVAGVKKLTEHGVDSLHCYSPDIILQGDIGSGRTESFIAAALYGALVRGQNVIFVTNSQRLSELVVGKINVRLQSLLLQNYVQCFQLTASPWELDETHRGLPCIYVGTPSAIEQHLFDSPGRVNDTVSPSQRRFVQETDLLLFDDMTELDVEVRAHLVFIIDKLRLLYASEDIVPQFVFATCRLHKIGSDKFIKRLFDGIEDDFNHKNLIVLRNRPAEKGWKLSIHTNFVATPEDVCKWVVKWCMLNRLNVLLYRKGVGHGFCADYKEQIKKELLKDTENPPPQDVLQHLSDRLAVVSSLDGSDAELERSQSSDVGAVLYFPELTGESCMAIRLNLAGGEPIFIRILECPNTASEFLPGSIPLLPNNTAVPLRNAHLRSVIRFIPQGTPIKAVVWNNFGIDAGSARVGSIQTRETETWIFDKWRDEQDAFMVQERDSVMAGKIDLSTLPEMDGYDIIRTADGQRLVFGKVENDDSIKNESHLLWIKDENRTESFIKGLKTDLAHANVMTAAYDGETYTIDRLVTVKQGGETKHRILAKMWNGDGNDKELPIKTLSWEVEPVCAPTAVALHDHLVEFKLPLKRNRYRSASVSIAGFCSFNGRKYGLADPVEFEYSVRYAGFALCPAGIDPKVIGAYTQSTLVGKWTTSPDCGFSPVATHLFTAAFKRLLPDLPFFATCPIFFTKDSPDAVAQAIMWVIEPINSGETAYPILKDVFTGAVDSNGGDIMPSVIKMVRAMAEALKKIHDAPSFVAYLRLLSGIAYNVDAFTQEALSMDLEATLALLDSFEDRIKGTAVVPPIVQPPVPPSLRTTWMSAPRTKEDMQGLATGDWNETPVLSYVKNLALDEKNDGAEVCKWTFESHKFEFRVGFADDNDNQEFVRTFMTWDERAVGGDNFDGRVYAEYGINDPYREYVRDVALKLKQLFDDTVAPSDDNKRRLAEFLLYFVQSGMDYRHDPSNKRSDWPRFPSETLANGAGDCEDTSILYMELLRHVGIENALFTVPRHACVGVEVPMLRTATGEDPVIYGWADKQYVYAETAMSKGHQVVLGTDCKNDDGSSTVSPSSIQHVVPTPMEVEMSAARILNVCSSRSKATVTVLAKDSSLVGSDVAVVCYARFNKYVFDEPADGASVCIGGLILPVKEAGIARACSIPLDASKVSGKGSWWLDVFVCDPQTGDTLGHFVGGEVFS